MLRFAPFGALVAAACLYAPAAAGTQLAASSWTASFSAPSDVHFYAVSCPSAVVCTAVGSDDRGGSAVFGTTDGGTSWGREMDAGPISDLSCPTPESCIAVSYDPGAFEGQNGVSDVLSTQDGGATWSGVDIGPSLYGFDLVGCAQGTAVCYATQGAEGTFVTTDLGANWTQVDSPYFPYDASCPTASTCYFLTANGLAKTTDTGATVTIVADDPNLIQLACPTVDDCAAVEDAQPGLSFLETTDGGSTWTLGTLPAGFENVSALSCPSLQDCEVSTTSTTGASETASTVDDGATWTVQSIPRVDAIPQGSVGAGNDLACPTTSSCYFADPNAAADTVFTNSGPTSPWAASTVLTGTSPAIEAVGCAPIETCVGVGAGAGVYSRDGGSSWARSITPPPQDAVVASVSCPTPAFCVAVGASSRNPGAAIEVRSLNGGVTWQPESVPAAPAAMTGITCPSTALCLATTALQSDLLRSTDGGRQWSSATLPLMVTALRDLSCVGNFCKAMAVGAATGRAELLVSSNGGARWVSRAARGAIGNSISLSCTSSSVCWSLMLHADQSDPTSPSWEFTVELSTDSGAAWRAITSVQLSSPTSGSIVCSAAECAILVGQPFTIETGGAHGSWTAPPIVGPVSPVGSLASRPAHDGWIAAGVNQTHGPGIISSS